MHDDRLLVEARLQRALDRYLRAACHPARVPLAVRAWHVPGEPVSAAEALRAHYQPFAPGTAWGPPWSTSWFRIEGVVPPQWAGRRVEALLDPGFTGEQPGFQVEGLVHDSAGVPVKGIHPRNRHVPVADPARGGEPVSLLLEAAANPTVLPGFRPTPLGDPRTAGTEPLFRFGAAELAVLDEEVWHLVLDIEVLAGLMHELDVREPRRHQILRALERALDALDLHRVGETATAARAELAGALGSPAYPGAHRLSATGHAHLDTAWLWPLRETPRKAARTFAGVLQLAGEYPELVFACSQAQQYAWTKEQQPLLWQRIRAAVADGTWVPVGSMWVEADTNLPGGEALARQIVHGKRFFRDELGTDTAELWLPDSFGYTAALPQLAALAGVHRLLAAKMTWNDTDRMPHHTFWWEGLDGTRVFTHIPPVGSYACELSGAELAQAVRTFAEHGAATRSLVPFGYGDGGGGPTREMMERARRLRSLAGSPRVAVEPPQAFFAAAEEEYGEQAPVWSGELYLERHRGTYTTQAAGKRGNRRSEHLLREAELWAATAAVRDPGYAYPYEQFDRLWKTVLLLQFHDILPGSSIAWVHREAREAYRQIHQELEEIIADALAVPGRGGRPALVNASPYPRREVVAVRRGAVPDSASAQPLPDGRVAVLVQAPALGGAAPAGLGHEPVTATRQGGGVLLENEALRVLVDGDGLLASVYDKDADREVLLPGGRGNLLQLHPDHPSRWDAWDLDAHYRRRRTDLVAAEAVEAPESGPLQAAVRVVRSFGDSRAVQRITLRAGSRRLEVTCDIDWHESEKVLKAAFPLDVHAERSTAEVQFGHVHRPTHTNTGWDAARFENFAHRWLRVAESGYGVAVLSDSVYGHDVTRTRFPGGLGTTVRLTLLRAPLSPDPQADQGRHTFRYALLPGASIGDAVAEGLALNLPLRAAAGAPVPLLTVDNPAITVEAVKLADDRSGDVVVRLYESHGGRARGTLVAGFPIAGAHLTDLLEQPLRGAEHSAGAVRLTLRPFQILTVRLRPRPA